MHRLDFHADDYGVSINNSKRIIELIRSGRADSISFIPNMGCFDECMALLKDNWDGFEKKPLPHTVPALKKFLLYTDYHT